MAHSDFEIVPAVATFEDFDIALISDGINRAKEMHEEAPRTAQLLRDVVESWRGYQETDPAAGWDNFIKNHGTVLDLSGTAIGASCTLSGDHPALESAGFDLYLRGLNLRNSHVLLYGPSIEYYVDNRELHIGFIADSKKITTKQDVAVCMADRKNGSNPQQYLLPKLAHLALA